MPRVESRRERLPRLTVAGREDVSCKFCQIVRQEIEGYIVFEDETSIAFLDHRPIFAGHCLVVPRRHYETLSDLPADQIPGFFLNVQRIARAVEKALHAEGSFVAINNRVSQGVPHIHVHIVPRRKGDGLKGFFWPRHPYKDAQEMLHTQKAIQSAMMGFRSPDHPGA
jgi:histidine triad (HIT) family protein